MLPLNQIESEILAQVNTVLTDIDDTLTLNGRIPATAFMAMEKLQKAGIKVIPVTGRPAGWCDHIARMWPVDGIVGENGAFYFYYQAQQHKMIRRYWDSEAVRQKNRHRLSALSDKILATVSGTKTSADQSYRETDLAIDFCEDVPPLPLGEVNRIVALFRQAGARAKVSSIHVNGWFGEYDKLAMTRILFQEIFNQELERRKQQVIFVGDSPNDVPMFRFFPHSVGVANITQFTDQLSAQPDWITEQAGGFGFAELVDRILKAKELPLTK
ncbi:MAG: HAD-IIB family hydrolase [Deltaproteobacteria bacterium]|jgi:HAD superfamily hydrolase (TIGR01484 family)|nr:HAD-IIB family hydrolase [Deltaproteobacteria bacterium]MCW9049738.1 HAD-IIB family hydrolase [Deltaproteobacteria bacterium]